MRSRHPDISGSRFVPALLTPHSEDIGDSAAGSLANINEVEHLQHGAVSGNGNAAALGGIDLNTEAAGIGQGDAVLFLDDHQSLPVQRVAASYCS